MSLLESAWLEVALGIAVAISTVITIFIFTLPTTYHPHQNDQLSNVDFTEVDREDADRSGYAYYQTHKDSNGTIATPITVDVVVLGDIGRSPRMQYHALSIASAGGKVNLIGYADSELHPNVKASRFIKVCPLQTYPRLLQTNNKLLFLLVAPLKVLWQIGTLYRVLAYRTSATRWMLVQNPPSIPTLAVAQFVCFFRNTRLVIDWHNFGYSILALRLGPNHPLVRFSRWYEGLFAQSATAHFAVTNAMCTVLQDEWGIKAQALHDRPPKHFQPLSLQQRTEFLHKLPEIVQYAPEIVKGTWRLLVSSTSWTPDEDFSLLLDALAEYSAATSEFNPTLPKILAIITGKGPQKSYYLSQIHRLNQENRLKHVVIVTAWLSTADYASLLGAADLGVSLHCSSSGVDLPMKVVDMFGTGLPVAGYGAFAAWPELVREGQNGRGFQDSEGLANILKDLFRDPAQLRRLRGGALRECERRWDDEWMPVAGKLLGLST